MASPFFRADALAKVTGRAVYGVDLRMPNMLVGGLLRSPVAAGRIRRLDPHLAEELPGVVVATAPDFPVSRYGMVIRDQPPLASDVVRYFAEPIAAVAAPDEARLVQALDAVQLDVEELPPVTDVEVAMLADARMVHPEWESYELALECERRGNICAVNRVQSGDVEAAFARASLVLEERYSTPRVHQGYIEPRACLAVPQPDGGFQVTTSTQAPFGVRGTLSRILGVPESLVRVTASTVGGGFGGKLDATLEHFACQLARKAGRPVKMVSSRAEELAAALPRENSVVYIRSAVDSEGRIIGRDVRCLLDAGAYAHDTPFLTAVATLLATGPYRIENVRAEALAVYTNTQPTGAYRGPTGPQMVLAVESHMDVLAERLGVDRVDFRRRHVFREGDRALNGQVVENVSIEECLQRAADSIGWNEPRSPGRGIGIACAWWTTTGGVAAATVKLETDGTLAIITGATEIGSGAVAAGIIHLAADAFGLPPGHVRLASTGDTGSGAYDFGAQGSRTTFSVGNAVLLACSAVRTQILDQAATQLEVASEDLTIQDGKVSVVGSPDLSVELGVVAAAAIASDGPIHASARFIAPPTPYDPSCVDRYHYYPAFNSPTFHCHAAEVEVDEETGKVRVLRYVAAQDVGRALVPPAAEGQIHGGVLQGLGLALYEEERLVDGRIANATLDGYKIPTIMEAPLVEAILVEQPSTAGPRGAKGVGEPPIILPAAVVVNAVAAATGVRMRELPLTPDRVLRSLDSKRAEPGGGREVLR